MGQAVGHRPEDDERGGEAEGGARTLRERSVGIAPSASLRTPPDFKHIGNRYVGVIVTYNTEGETPMNSFEHLLYDALLDAMDAAWKAADAANAPVVEETLKEAA